MDELTLLTLRVIALEEALKKIPDYKIGISNLSARLKNLEDQKLPQAISVLENEVRELKKASQISESVWLPREGKELKKKFSIMDWFK
jgi:hypothetical protein